MKYLKESNNDITTDYEVFTNDRFWGTIGAGILPYCTTTKKFLIAYRSEFVNEPNTWEIWGGKLDDQETNDPKEAAVQELKEETGYSGNVKLIDAHIYEQEKEGKVIFTYYNYIGLIDKEFNVTLDWENEGYKWVDISELYQISPKHFGLESLLTNSKDLINNL